MGVAQDRERLKTIAPLWRTGCLLAFLATASALSAYLKVGAQNPNHGHLPLYGTVIVLEWAQLALAQWGADEAFRAYVGQTFRNARSLVADVPIAVGLSAVCYALALVLIRVLGQSGWGAVTGILPGNTLEICAWIVMAVSAGFCEEVVFRGHLQQQFAGWTGHLSAGIVCQAAIFGLSHAYQGWKSMSLIFVIGCVYGCLVPLRKSLRSNMISHAGMDILAGFGG